MIMEWRVFRTLVLSVVIQSEAHLSRSGRICGVKDGNCNFFAASNCE